MRASIVAGNGVWDEFDSGRGALPADWHHVTVTVSSSAKMMIMYLDGEVVGSKAGMTNSLNMLGNTTQNWIGRSTYSDPYFNGTVDDFRIYKRVLSQTEIQKVMENVTEASARPNPRDRATDVIRDVILSWVAGPFAAEHDVYFGSSFDDVNTASRTAPKGVLASQGQKAVTFDPAGLLEFGQTYYWRVDEVNAAPDSFIYKGGVWSFTAETYGYRIATPIKATASSFSNALTGPDKTIDGSGLDALDQHSTSASQMWLSKKAQTPVWIKYEFDQVYSLHQMWVWNQNQIGEPDNGYGAKDVTIETSIDGTTWSTLAGVPEFAQATGEPNYVYNTTVDFGGVQAKFVKLTIGANWAGGTTQAGLSEVRFFYIQE